MSRPPALRSGRDFQRVYSSGRKARRDGVTVFVAEASGRGGRTGIVVPGRVGGAVQRNRVKRRIRSILAGLELPRDVDVVVHAGASTPDVRFQELENHVSGALRAAGGVT